MLDIENFDQNFKKIVNSKNWKKIESLFAKAQNIFMFGNGGNLAIADHAAIDVSRLTDKNCIAPGSGIVATSIIGDKDAESWFKTWLEYRLRGLDTSKCMVISFSCSTSGTSSNASVKALTHAADLGIPVALISAQPKPDLDERIILVSQNVSLYHTSEIMSLALTYQLTHSAGFKCPSVFKKARDRKFEKLGIVSEVKQSYNQHVPPGFESQLKNLAIDFDGVVHTFDKGWHDGTCYGEPLAGSLEAIKELSKEWNIIIFSAKVRPDRPLVGGKTGHELVEEWLVKHDVMQYIDEITHEKPRATYYIDDKAIEFKDNWSEVLARLSK
jgi:hypothetical protein